MQGIRVLDLTWVLGGPFAGQTLAQMGAEVIKVEPVDGDSVRSIGNKERFKGDTGFFLSVNRGKSSIAINIKDPAGLAVLYDLVRVSDAIIYGFAPDVPGRLKIDAASLHKINPKIAVAQLIGMHDQPPYSNAPSYDLVTQALGGVMGMTGEEGGQPVRVGYQIADLAGGLYLALACAGAVITALKSGKGSAVQISLLDCQLALLTWQAQNYFVSGREPTRLGARHPIIAPNDIYPCSDGRFLAISPTGENFWRAMCEAIGRDDLITDPRFQTLDLRVQNVAELTGVLKGIFARAPVAEWVQRLFDARVAAGAVNSVSEAVNQPLAGLRNMVDTLGHPDGAESMRFLGNPFKYEGSRPLSYPPALGAQTREILTRICQYPAVKIDQLVASGILFANGE
jgi:CoA:oxalate CoA-transferase